MKTIKVKFDNGDELITRINGTESDIKKYYIGNTFNMGRMTDCMAKAVSVEFLE